MLPLSFGVMQNGFNHLGSNSVEYMIYAYIYIYTYAKLVAEEDRNSKWMVPLQKLLIPKGQQQPFCPNYWQLTASISSHLRPLQDPCLEGDYYVLKISNSGTSWYEVSIAFAVAYRTLLACIWIKGHDGISRPHPYCSRPEVIYFSAPGSFRG